MQKKAIIIGAGPAGLTAAYELLKRTDIVPVILEKSGDIGGISKTVNYKGNRMDIGGHRFFSKSDRVMEWWLNIMPMQSTGEKEFIFSYQGKKKKVSVDADSDNKADTDNVMLVRKRLSRIYFLRKFFTYPIQLSLDTLKKLGFFRTMGIIISYCKARLLPRKPEKNLEDFFINRFGDKLYRLFFKDYTEKVWGVSCERISAEWGAQRIKGISIAKALAHAVRSMRPGSAEKGKDISQKGTETSLIEQFLYPKFGPGQLWEEVARQVVAGGGQLYLNQEVKKIDLDGDRVRTISTADHLTGETKIWEGDYFFSTMPVQELIGGMDDQVPENVKKIAAGLQYRDFITVGVLLRKMQSPLPDTWLYIQEKEVKVGRLQLFNNWSPYMINDPDTTWIGMEYFCNVTDDFWKLSDQDIRSMAILELNKIGLASVEDVLDCTVLRVEKTYPAYFGTYDRFEEVRSFTDNVGNLFLVGRNGMHKYNNSDHSMLTAMVAVDNIEAGIVSKENIWSINTEQEYHEEKEVVRSPVTAEPAVIQPTEPSFIDFVWKNKWNRGYLLFAFFAFLLQYVLFKVQYPFANYMPDSYSYLEAAYTNADVNTWPVAYSKFLRVISAFTHSDKLVVGFQYLLLQTSSLLFLVTSWYFLKPGKVVKNILYIFFVFNPVFLYISNYISADALFISLSLFWMNSLLWILYRSGRWEIFIQAMLLLACFTVRYNAIYYPLIAAFVFILSRQRWTWKLSGIGLGTALIISSVLYTSAKMQETTGIRQFSAFGGWQLASNAMLMYRHIDPAQHQAVPDKFQKMDEFVTKVLDSIVKDKRQPDSNAAIFYLWDGRSPLHRYAEEQYKKDSTTPAFKRWASMAPDFGKYGLSLIEKYPMEFAKSFLYTNFIRYAVPPAEFLGIYNMGGDTVMRLAKDWFNYRTLKVRDHNNKNIQVGIAGAYPYFSAIINALLVISIVGLAFFSGFRNGDKGLLKFLYVAILLWLVNMGFSVFASPIVLRYQVFPLLISMYVSLMAIEEIVKLGKAEEMKEKMKNKFV